MTVLSSLTNRIFIATVLLVVVSIGLAMYRVQALVSSRAEADLRADLGEAVSRVDAISRTQFQDFVLKAQLIANLPVLRGAAATDDPPTVRPIAREYQQTIGADLFAVIGTGHRILAQVGGISIDPSAVTGIIDATRGRSDASTFWPIPGGLLHAAAIPLDAGLTTLIVGTRLDREAADRIKAITGTEIAFLSRSEVVASSIPLGPTAPSAGAADADGVFGVTIDGESYVGRLQPLGTGASADDPVALVLRSRSEQMRFLQRIRLQLAGTGVVAVLVGTGIGYLVARTVTRPLRALTATMREIATTGDLDRTIPSLRHGDDEDVRLLAATFRQLTGALERFRREAAVRDRLSSLGRLSAVIAHEIRNPLMIIKASVRGLRRSPSEDVAQLANSIDEEVARLNRVVAGVLDFSRPIRFELTRANLAEICRAAVEAATASGGAVPIRLDVDEPGLNLVTDTERLRLVLVNLLNNAQQAVESTDTRDGSAVVLRTRSLAGGRCRIEVEDRGPGIAAEALPQMFEPFFTTKSTGSGLGLAISRSIVEGLGGAIEATNRPGGGTIIRIDLPDATPAREVAV